MGTIAGDGLSGALNPGAAGREAANQACAKLSGRPPDCCIVFATAGYDQSKLLAGVREVTGPIPLTGCSGEGVIGGSISEERERAVAVLAISSTNLHFDSLLLPDFSRDPGLRGLELGQMILERCHHKSDELVGLLLFPDGLTGNCTPLLGNLHGKLGEIPLKVGGGTAGDAMLFEQTYQYCDGRVISDGIAALLIRGQGEMKIGVSHGCTPLGLERRITRAADGWIHEIDGLPAWDVFKEYLEGDPQDLHAEGIAHLSVGELIRPGHATDYETYVIHVPLRLDNATGSLFFPSGGLVEGKTIRLTRRHAARIREGAIECGRTLVAEGGGPSPAFVVQIDCAGRGRVLFGARASSEIIAPVRAVVGDQTPWVGFHSFGEIAPLDEKTRYHNYTVALCAVYDRGTSP